MIADAVEVRLKPEDRAVLEARLRADDAAAGRSAGADCLAAGKVRCVARGEVQARHSVLDDPGPRARPTLLPGARE